MTTKTIYYADDGTEFENEDMCIAYESGLTLKYVFQNAEIYYQNGTKASPKSIMMDDVYAINAHTDRALSEFSNAYRDTCYLEAPDDLHKGPGFYYIDENGDWKHLKSQFKELEEILKNYKLKKSDI